LLAATEAPLRQAVVPLQRGQTRSPDQALSNTALQLRHKRGSRTIDSLLGFVGYSGLASTQFIRRYEATTTRIRIPSGATKHFTMVASPFPG